MRAIVLSSLLALSSCSMFSSPGDTLSVIQGAAVASRMTAQPVIDAICANELEKCDALKAQQAQDASGCPGFDACNHVRMIVIGTLQAVQFAIADANLAIALGQEDKYDEAIKRAMDLLLQIQGQMQVLGIIPGGSDVTVPG